MKKIAVIKIGARISFGSINKNGELKDSKDTSGGNGEAKAIIKMLDIANYDITILTKVLDKDYLPEKYKFADIVEMFTTKTTEEFFKKENFDSLIILNGNFNCFGGAEKSILLDLANYDAINKFDKTPYLCLCDIALVTTKDIYSTCKNKPWGNKYDESLNIVRDDIHIITQAHDISALYNLIKKNKRAINVKKENISYFPFEKFPLITNDLSKYKVNENYEYDLSYGGTMRANRRTKKLVKFYYNHDKSISVNIFGKMKQDVLEEEAKKQYGVNFSSPTITGPVLYTEYCDKMNSSLSHVVIGDKIYEECDYIPQRCYESILSNVVTFIDSDLDKTKRVYEDETLKDFLYVSNVKELDKKITKLKEDDMFRFDIIKKCNETIVDKIDIENYCKLFSDIIK